MPIRKTGRLGKTAAARKPAAPSSSILAAPAEVRHPCEAAQ
ncbi:MAG: hypothetical protein NTW87_15055 [Planctomycetota bacterium]|nr:hypothetical protein [Planctomycetota bacterium]